MRKYYVYIMASKKNGTLYVGVTSNLSKRVGQHKNKIKKGFTSKYAVSHLVYYEVYEDIFYAIAREKKLKKLLRKDKLALIEKINPHWEELYPEW